MIYEFKIEEKSSTTISVRAQNPDEAQKIFDAWYQKHEVELDDALVAELLDNGYEGRTFKRSVGMDEESYYPKPVMLPEESAVPQENIMNLQIRFADGSEDYQIRKISFGEIASILNHFERHYHLFPDPEKAYWKSKTDMYIYAVLKDTGETWKEFNYRKDRMFCEKSKKTQR